MAHAHGVSLCGIIPDCTTQCQIVLSPFAAFHEQNSPLTLPPLYAWQVVLMSRTAISLFSPLNAWKWFCVTCDLSLPQATSKLSQLYASQMKATHTVTHLSRFSQLYIPQCCSHLTFQTSEPSSSSLFSPSTSTHSQHYSWSR